MSPQVSPQQLLTSATSAVTALAVVAMTSMAMKTMLKEDDVRELAMLPLTLRGHRLTAAEAAYLNNLGGVKRELFRQGDTIESALAAKGYVPRDVLDEGTFKGWEQALDRMPGRPRSLQSRIDNLEDRIAGLGEAIDKAEDEGRDTAPLEVRKRALEDQLAALENRLADQEESEA